MRLRVVVFALFITSVVAPANAPAEWPFAPPDPDQPYATDHVIIQFKGDAAEAAATQKRNGQLHASLGLPANAEFVETEFARTQRNNAKKNTKTPQAAGPDFKRRLFLRLPDTWSVEQCVRRLKDHPMVDYVEPDYIGKGGILMPNDPDFEDQWHLYNTNHPSYAVRPDIHSLEAWNITKGSTSVVVAVLDTGLNMSLAEFSNRVVAGYDFANNDSDPTDDHNHGTAVASTIGANANNNTLITGVDWYCRIMPVKVLNSGNSGLYSWWADGIDWAVSNGCKVINLSAGGSSSSTTLSNAIMNAVASGVIFITITHNDGSSTIRFPGRMEPCITVGATDSDDDHSSFSNYGSAIDLVAPGRDIRVLLESGSLSTWYGTSFAAPQVAAVAAMLAALDPDISHEQARTLLCAGADDEVGGATDTPGFDSYFGWGRLNAYNTLHLAQTKIQAQDAGGNLSWAGPPNASNKTPYKVESAPSPAGPWTPISLPGDFSYSPTQTVFQGGIMDTTCVYRVRITE